MEVKKKLYAKYTATNGHDYDREDADKELETDKSYLVEEINIGGWDSDVKLVGFDQNYNTVMFEFYIDGCLEEYDIIKDPEKLSFINHNYRMFYRV